MDKQRLIEGIKKIAGEDNDIYIKLLEILISEGDNLSAVVEKMAKVTEKTQDEVKAILEIKDELPDKGKIDSQFTETIKYLLSKKSGWKSDLIDSLGIKLVERLMILGYISTGVSFDKEGNPKETWGITEACKRFHDLFIKELTEQEKVRGRYLHSIGV